MGFFVFSSFFFFFCVPCSPFIQGRVTFFLFCIRRLPVNCLHAHTTTISVKNHFLFPAWSVLKSPPGQNLSGSLPLMTEDFPLVASPPPACPPSSYVWDITNNKIDLPEWLQNEEKNVASTLFQAQGKTVWVFHKNDEVSCYVTGGEPKVRKHKIMVNPKTLTLRFGIKPRIQTQRQTHLDAETNLAQVCLFQTQSQPLLGLCEDNSLKMTSQRQSHH